MNLLDKYNNKLIDINSRISNLYKSINEDYNTDDDYEYRLECYAEINGLKDQVNLLNEIIDDLNKINPKIKFLHDYYNSHEHD